MKKFILCFSRFAQYLLQKNEYLLQKNIAYEICSKKKRILYKAASATIGALHNTEKKENCKEISDMTHKILKKFLI